MMKMQPVSWKTNEALGLKQHMTFATHTSGNTLDLIFTEINGGIGIADCISESYISDHCNILCKLSLRREDIQRKTVKYRTLTNMDTEEMAKHIKVATGSERNLDDRVRNFNNALTSSLMQLHQYRPSRLQYGEQLHGTQMMPDT